MTEDENAELDQMLEELYGDGAEDGFEDLTFTRVPHVDRDFFILVRSAIGIPAPDVANPMLQLEAGTMIPAIPFGVDVQNAAPGSPLQRLPVLAGVDEAGQLIAFIYEAARRFGLVEALHAAVDGAGVEIRLNPTPPLS